jgi:translation initiation factor 1 (eIF-1/SUI1)
MEEKKPPAPGSTAKTNPFEALRQKLGPLPPGPVSSARPSAADPRAPKPVPERVTVRRERTGRGGKTVTIAEGPGFTGRKLEPLAREAARALGVGARVEHGALVVQGDQADRLAAWLSTRGFERVERGN